MFGKLLVLLCILILTAVSLSKTEEINRLKEHVKYQQEAIQYLKSELEYKDLVLTNKCKI